MQNNINEWENEDIEQYESDDYISDDDLEAEDDEFEGSEDDEYSEDDDESDDDYESDEDNESDESEENRSGLKKKVIIAAIAVILLLLLLGGGFAGMQLMKKHASNSNVSNVEETQDVNTTTVVDENGEELSVINIENEDASEPKTAENPVLPADEKDGGSENEIAKTDNSSLEIEEAPQPVKMDTGLDIDDVKVSIGDVGRKNPFVPFDVDKSALKSEDIVQTSSIGFDVIEPPSLAEVNPGISKLFSTKVSGILYDEIRPSAILNIDGFDQLVRIGDTLGGFSILNITKNKVVIKSGVNVYRASVGQPLNAEKVVTSAEISNLEHKFYGSNKK